MKKERAICYFCGKRVEFTLGEPPCKVLRGWLIVFHWRGLPVDHYSFCSFSCLQRWVEPQVPKIPEVFLKSLGGENDKT